MKAILAAAATIKQAARQRAAEPPVVEANSPVAAYVINGLLWNPLTDTSQLLREAQRDFVE
ncbi:MAG: hypothetical protein WD042_17010 [Phycisphaeraceae bacterium]